MQALFKEKKAQKITLFIRATNLKKERIVRIQALRQYDNICFVQYEHFKTPHSNVKLWYFIKILCII